MGSRAPSIDWAWLGRLAPRVAVLGVVSGLLLAIASPSGDTLGGDYPVFHAVGRMVLDGHAGDLYDFHAVERYEQGLPFEGYLVYPYPPFFAVAFAPLAALPYRASYAAFALLSIGALAAAVRLLSPVSRFVGEDPWRAFALALLFYPALRSVLGGQNTALSLLLLAGAWRMFDARRDFVAGLVLGLLGYKPQLLVPMAGIVLLAGRPRAAAGAVASVAVLYGGSTIVLGPAWIGQWIHVLQTYLVPDRELNAYKSVSLARLADFTGWEHAWVLPSLAVALWTCRVAVGRGRADFLAVLAIATVAALLVPPHAMFYDLGLTLPGLALLADRGRAREAGLLWLGGAAQLLAPPLPASPLVFVLVAMALLLRRELRA